MRLPLRERTTPLQWFIVGLAFAFAFYAWSFFAWYNLASDRNADLANNAYEQCVQDANRDSHTHEVLIGIISLAVDGDMTDPHAKAIVAYLDQQLPPRNCANLKP